MQVSDDYIVQTQMKVLIYSKKSHLPAPNWDLSRGNILIYLYVKLERGKRKNKAWHSLMFPLKKWKENNFLYVCLSARVITTLDKADQVKIDILSKSIIENWIHLRKSNPILQGSQWRGTFPLGRSIWPRTLSLVPLNGPDFWMTCYIAPPTLLHWLQSYCSPLK